MSRPSTTRTSSNALKSPPLLKIFKDFEASGTDLSMWHRWCYCHVLSNDQSYGYTYCKGQLQGSNAGKGQNFGDEGGKRVVTASGYVPSDRRGVTDRDWEGTGNAKGRAKLNRQADYYFKNQGKYILKKTPGEHVTTILRNHQSNIESICNERTHVPAVWVC